MARKSKEVRKISTIKYKVRIRNRCKLCGRSRGYFRRFGICRLCFRELVYKGEIPGVRKASW